jgi:glyoxylase-like metal-dependent hydrolase (beta-lactamase superfamily II)
MTIHRDELLPFTARKPRARRAGLALTLACALTLGGAIVAQAAEGGVRPGVLPDRWLLGGPNCIELPEFQIHEYNPDLYILRQSGCSNDEKPLLYLLFGQNKALLLDTGAGKTEVARTVKTVIGHWLERNKKASIPLVVGHLHGHDDHTGGDPQFASAPDTTLIAPKAEAVKAFFGFKAWPKEIVQYDLGGRVLDIIPIPGHDDNSIAIYDRQTGLLLTGDTLYPGRIYVNDTLAEFAASIERLVDFTKDKTVTHVLGTHIENSRTPYKEYAIHTVYQPDEHVLELGRAHLLELHDAVKRMNGTLKPVSLRDFSVCGKYPTCER